jgi:ATP-dependent helicase/nuclease subunit B
MSAAFPTISEQKQPYAWSIAPNAQALKALAEGIWSCAEQTQQRPLVVLSTAGPLIGLREALEEARPKNLPNQIAFLPQVISFADWLEAAPNAWKFPKKQSDLERWLGVYATLREHRELQTWFKAETEVGAWGLAQAIIKACDILSKSVLPQLQKQMYAGLIDQDAQKLQVSQAWMDQVKIFLEKMIAEVYPELSRKVVDQEAHVLLTFWRFITSASDPVFREQLAMGSHLEAIARAKKENQERPLIWVETADPSPIDKEIIGTFLREYAHYAPVIEVTMDWWTVGLWPEAIDAEGAQVQAYENAQNNYSPNWQLKGVKGFEELAWLTAKTIEQHVIAGKKKIALVAQDRLVARRARALLTRLGPSLNIHDETGWKLSTTRAAAAFNSWLELIRSPKDGPSAKVLLEFLQNPFIEIHNPQWLDCDPELCIGLIAELEDILISSKAESGWKTFHLAIEGATANAQKKSSALPNPTLFKLLQFLRERHHEWQILKVDCHKAYSLLEKNLVAIGMTNKLSQDSAGKQLLEIIKTFDLHSSAYRQVGMRLSEWLSLMKTVIEGASYQEEGKEAIASLNILPLSSTRLKKFDAVVMVGCDEQQLPAYAEPPLFFSDALNQFLRTSTIALQFQQQARDLSQLLVAVESVDLLWQSRSKNGEPLRPSAWIQRLQSQLDWKPAVMKTSQRKIDTKPLFRSVAHLEEGLAMPLSMSPSAYKALRDCPYRYYVRSLLGLRKTKGFDEGFDASLAGQTLHAILKIFYHALKTEGHNNPELNVDQQLRREWMEKRLSTISEQSFKELIEGDARVMGTLRDWQKQIPSFIEWQLEREQQGWEYFDGEVKVGFDLTFQDADGNPREIRIEGYADRFDIQLENPQLASVIDYKHQTFKKVKDRAEHILDDPQLLIYARAANEGAENHKIVGHQVRQAEWVSLKADVNKDGQNAQRSQEVSPMPELMQEFSVQITQDLEDLWAKKPMEAFAPDGVCQYCEARGLCRKGVW